MQAAKWPLLALARAAVEARRPACKPTRRGETTGQRALFVSGWVACLLLPNKFRLGDSYWPLKTQTGFWSGGGGWGRGWRVREPMRGEVEGGEGGGGGGAEREHLFLARSKLCANYKTLETQTQGF